MSLRAILWAFDQEVYPASNKFVLVALANFCNDECVSYPSAESIGKLTSLHPETVGIALDKLVKQGIIVDTGRTTGNTGRIKVFRLPDEVGNHRESDDYKKRVKSSDNPRIILGQSSERPAHHNKEQEQEQEQPLTALCKLVFEAWNKTKGIPVTVLVLSDKRRRALEARLGDKFFAAHWKEALSRIPGSKFLCGGNPRSWKASFDWFLQPDSVAKIMEDRYGVVKPSSVGDDWIAELEGKAP